MVRSFLLIAALCLLTATSCIMTKVPYVNTGEVLAKDVVVEVTSIIYQEKNLKHGFYVMADAKEIKLSGNARFDLENDLQVSYGFPNGITKTYDAWDQNDLKAHYLQNRGLKVVKIEYLCYYNEGKKGKELFWWPIEIKVTVENKEGKQEVIRKTFSTFEIR